MQPHVISWALAVLLGLTVFQAAPVSQAPTGTLTGAVVDRSGSPLPGVTVAVTPGGSSRTTALGEAITDTSGTFRIPNLAPGVYQVAATMPGFVMANGPTRAVIVWPGRESAAELWMFAEQRGERDEDWRQHELGRVRINLRRWHEAGISNYRLAVDKECFCDRSIVPETAEELFERVASAVETRPDGFVALYDPHTGLPTYLHVDPRASSVDDEVTLRVMRFEEVPAAATTGVVEGRFFEPGRDGVADVVVTLTRGGRRSATSTTDATGTFRIGDLAPGVYQVGAALDGYQQLSVGAPIVVSAGKTATAEWPMVPDRLVEGATDVSPGRSIEGGEIVGRVVDTSGAAVPGVRITLRGDDGLRAAVTDIAGRYVLSNLPDGEFLLDAELTGFRMFRGAGRTLDRRVQVRSGRRLDVGLLVFAGLRGDGSEADRAGRIAELDAMVTRWHEARPEAYEWTVRPSEGLRALAVRVSGDVGTFAGPPGRVREVAEDFATYFEAYLHVHQMFETVARAIDWRPDEFNVKYDPVYGFPSSILIRVRAGVRDPSLDIDAAAFRVIEGGGL